MTGLKGTDLRPFINVIMLLPMQTQTDHPLRYAMVNELHARPFPALPVPCTAIVLAYKQPLDAANRDRSLDRAHLLQLIARHGGDEPGAESSHWSGELGRATLKWESHTEFVSYAAFVPGVSARPFDPVDAAVFPLDWQAQAPGQRIAAMSIRVEVMPDSRSALLEQAEQWFVPESLAVSEVVDAAAVIAGDFRIDPAGLMRFAVFVKPGTGPRRVGRIVQRICEIETYRAMSMLGLMRARALSSRLNALDPRLTALVAGLDAGWAPADGSPTLTLAPAAAEMAPELALHDLLSISAELERLAVGSSFRFGATAAYEAILNQRVAVLRESRIDGRQAFGEFMMRRYDPAMRTVKSAEARLRALSERAQRAAELLRTRVDVDRSAQNQRLLESMDRRADLALRLQHTVEGLSVVAISYYALSLAAAAALPLAQWWGWGKEAVTAALVVPVLAAVWWALRRIRRKIH